MKITYLIVLKKRNRLKYDLSSFQDNIIVLLKKWIFIIFSSRMGLSSLINFLNILRLALN